MLKDRELKIFVYGSLREGFFNYIKYLEGNVSDKEIGKIKGTLYHMPNKGYPALLDGSNDIIGEVYTLYNFKENILRLDDMEGYYGPSNPKNEYERLVDDVTLENGDVIKCYTYKYMERNDEFINNRILIEDGDWSNYIKSHQK